jgi:hypothetical protein
MRARAPASATGETLAGIPGYEPLPAGIPRRDVRGIAERRRSFAPKRATKHFDLQVFYGSNGTRTRDLRRDRPSRAPQRLATNSSVRPHLQGFFDSRVSPAPHGSANRPIDVWATSGPRNLAFEDNDVAGREGHRRARVARFTLLGGAVGAVWTTRGEPRVAFSRGGACALGAIDHSRRLLQRS